MQLASNLTRVIFLVLIAGLAGTKEPFICSSGPTQSYSIHTSWEAMNEATNAEDATVSRVSGSNGLTGFSLFGLE